MTWTVNEDTGNYEFRTTVGGITTTEIFDTSMNPISSGWTNADGSEGGSIGEVVDTVSFDYNNDGNATSSEVIKETGTNKYTWQDGSTTVTETITFTNYYSNDGGYSRMDSQDEQELVNLMEEKIDHPFREEIRVIVHKNDSHVEGVARLNH